MWFGGQGKDGHDRIQLAESHDGLTWQSHGVVLEDPSANHVNDPSVVKRGDTYFMYYTRAATDIRDEIALAISDDGIHWTKRGVVLLPSPSGSWDSLLVGRPSVLFDGDRFRMWYDGRKDLPLGAPAPDNLKSATSARAVGYAESHDGFHWTRRQPTPVFGENAGGVAVVRIGNHYAMVYESAAGTQLAVSSDGLAWQPKGLFVPLSGGDLDRYGHVTPFLLVDDKSAAASLFVGAARNGRWDENVIARIDLTPTQLEMLRAQPPR
jgi:sucrose-6-phosphate hydrolase SacC (GH32 family)